jgi:hypothetical protein
VTDKPASPELTPPVEPPVGDPDAPDPGDDGASSWAAIGAGLTLALALIGVSGAIALGSRRRRGRM